MIRKNKKRFAAFSYKVAEIFFVGTVIAGFMQTTFPTWKMLTGGAIALIFSVIGWGFDELADHHDHDGTFL